MKSSVSFLFALSFSLLTTLPLQAQAPKAKPAAKAEIKKAPKAEKAPAKEEVKKDAKAKKATAKAEAKNATKAEKAPAKTDTPKAAKADPADCPCMKHVTKLEKMLAFHQAAADVYKKDPVLKVKDFKGKARKAYKRRAKMERNFHKAIANQLKKKIKFFKRASKKCQMPKLMSEVPAEVKELLKARKEKLQKMHKEAEAAENM